MKIIKVKARITGKQGQSLIELIAALVVMSIVVLGLVAVTTYAVRNASFARNQSLATQHAQEGVETVRAYRDKHTWDDFTANCSTILDSQPPLPSPFARSLECNFSGENGEIKVNVSWNDAQGLHQSELTTRLSNWR